MSEHASALPSADLGSVLGRPPVDRTSNLRLSRRPSPVPDDAPGIQTDGTSAAGRDVVVPDGATPESTSGSRGRNRRPASDRAPAKAPTPRRNAIRQSTLHIPVALLGPIAEERAKTGRSNGQIVIAAVEATHKRLTELIGQQFTGGGGLFEQRATRAGRQHEGPTTQLNVRLYEQDYEVLDQQVAAHGASSRGHLATVAMTAYFNDPHALT